MQLSFKSITDNEAPIISDTSSTQNLTFVAILASAVVTWTVPTASDNSGEAVTLTSDYSPGDVFLLGNTTVTYTATDVYGNTGTYSFNVEVTGNIFLLYIVLRG